MSGWLLRHLITRRLYVVSAAIVHYQAIASPLFHKLESVRHGPSENIRVEQYDDSNDGTESNRVPRDKAENDSFVADLLGSSGRNRDRLRIDHFPHHTSGAVGRAHKDRVDAQLLRSNSLQAAKERVRRRVTAGKRHSEPT